MKTSNNNPLSFSAFHSWLKRVGERYFRLEFLPANSGIESSQIDNTPGVFSPLSGHLSFPKGGDDAVAPSISSLSFVSYPSAIARLVVAVIIFSFQLQGWAITRGQGPTLEHSKVVEPLFAHPDSTLTVPGVIFVGLSVASAENTTIDSVQSVVSQAHFHSFLAGSVFVVTSSRTELSGGNLTREAVNDWFSTDFAVGHKTIVNWKCEVVKHPWREESE